MIKLTKGCLANIFNLQNRYQYFCNGIVPQNIPIVIVNTEAFTINSSRLVVFFTATVLMFPFNTNREWFKPVGKRLPNGTDW
jgi:hypothetical protein